MKTFKPLCLLAGSLLLGGILSGCGGCKHEYARTQSPGIFQDTVITHTCTKCGESYTEAGEPASRSLKILAIGNSFSVNPTTHLYDIATACGGNDVVIGCLWIGGAPLDVHADNVASGQAAYEYRKNNSGQWEVRQNVTLLEGIQDEDWDFIVLQQASILSGQPESYGPLTTLLDYVEEKRTNPACQLWWQMTWSYDDDYTANRQFVTLYDHSSEAMYRSVVETVESEIIPNERFTGIIPSATTMQNLRTSWASGLITQDGYHASIGIGCYALGLTWISAMTDADIASIEWFPKQRSKWGTAYDEALRDIAKEATLFTKTSPFAPSQSSFTVKPEFESR